MSAVTVLLVGLAAALPVRTCLSPQPPSERYRPQAPRGGPRRPVPAGLGLSLAAFARQGHPAFEFVLGAADRPIRRWKSRNACSRISRKWRARR